MPDFDSFNERLSALEFIRQKTLDGDWIHITGTIDVLNDDLVYTPANGKTFFLYSAKIVMTTNPSLGIPGTGAATSNDQVVADLKIDTVVEDTASIGTFMTASKNTGSAAGAGAGMSKSPPAHFDVTGLYLVGDGVKEVAIENVLDAGNARATLRGWIEDT